MSSDGNLLAVGSPRADQLAGAVYIYSLNNDAWEEMAYIQASNPGRVLGVTETPGHQSGDFFGTAVSLSGDGNTLAVGAIGESSSAIGVNGNQLDNSVSFSGAAYVFVKNNNEWLQQAYIKASNTEGNDNFAFGLSLSLDGETLTVSAPQEDSAAVEFNGDQDDKSQSNTDAVYLY